MAESSTKVRLVRCPKCENLLPELPDYSVYQCGGCGAVLRANKTNVDGVVGTESPVEVKPGVLSEKYEKKPEDSQGKEKTLGVENGNKLNDNDEGNEILAENGPKEAVSEKPIENGKRDSAIKIPEPKMEESKPHTDNANGLRTSGRTFRQRMRERVEGEAGIGRTRRNEFEETRVEGESTGRIRRGEFEGIRFPNTSDYLAEGATSRYHNYDNGLRNQSGVSRSNRGVDYVEPEREELLRKLDLLKDQLSRYDMNDKPTRENVPPPNQRMVHPDPYVESDDWLPPDRSSGFHSRQFRGPVNNVRRSHCIDDYPEPLPAMNRSAVHNPLHRYHSSLGPASYIPSNCEDLFETQILGRPPPQTQRRRPPPYQPQRTHPYLPGQYVPPEPGPFEPHPSSTIHSQPSCYCYECYDKHQQVPLAYPSTSCCNRRFPHVSNNHVPFHPEDRGFLGPRGYASRIVKPPLVASSYDEQSRARLPRDYNHDLGSLARSRPQRVVLADGRHISPVAGGAPFVTCHNCFELLQLPKRVVHSGKGSCKISCGSCGSVVSLAVMDEKLVSVDTPLKQNVIEPLDSSNEMAIDKPYISTGGTKLDNSSFHSEEYENSGYDFQSMDREHISSSTGQGLNSNKSEELHNLCSLSPSTSEEDDCPDELIPRHGRSNTAEMPQLSVSPPGEHFDNSSKYRAVNRCGKGNLSSRSDQERVVPNKSTLRQNSLKESLATEMEISINDYANGGASQDSTDTSKEDDQPKSKKGVDSFLAGIIKKSFRDFAKSNQTAENGRRNVSINGHQIPDRLVKKAEKLAGPIAPGHYWYDFRAGFWGVMGGPCMGIIPPHIEEFNYPMVEKCAAGNTGVFVNGRELHQKDFELLISRGLPASRDKCYLIDISGKVVDEDSGEELDSLGKLAPTVEKVKHGFGMRVSKASS